MDILKLRQFFVGTGKGPLRVQVGNDLIADNIFGFGSVVKP